MKTIIIAEAGVNHNGSLEMALDMVKAAAEAGADYIKFQTFKAENLVTASARKAEYQKQNCGDSDASQLNMLKALELSAADFAIIADKCNKEGIGFMSTPFDMQSVDTLASIGMDFWKIPSGEITNLPLMRKIGAQGGKIILSTGMSTMAEVEAAVDALAASGVKLHDIYLLHCTTQYPAPLHSVNLRAMDALHTFHTAGVGYSDHTAGILVPIAAVALGAKIVEKHFTLNRNLPGPDHKASIETDELKKMVEQIRDIETALGEPDKNVAEAEAPNRTIARKSIVASRHIAAGEILTEENLACKRPASGLSPMLWDQVVGTRAVRDFMPDEPIEI